MTQVYCDTDLKEMDTLDNRSRVERYRHSTQKICKISSECGKLYKIALYAVKLHKSGCECSEKKLSPSSGKITNPPLNLVVKLNNFTEFNTFHRKIMDEICGERNFSSLILLIFPISPRTGIDLRTFNEDN